MAEQVEFNEKQQQIMAIALELFANNGYDKTSIRDIAREAEVNLAMISYYFGSKDKLLEAIFTNHFQTIRAIFKQILHEADNSAIDKIGKIIDMFIDLMAEKQPFQRLMQRESSVLKQGPLFDMINEMRMVNKRLLMKAIDKGQRLGLFRKDVDAFFMSTVLVGSVNQNMSNTRYELEYRQIEGDAADTIIHERREMLRAHLKRMFIAYLTETDLPDGNAEAKQNI